MPGSTSRSSVERRAAEELAATPARAAIVVDQLTFRPSNPGCPPAREVASRPPRERVRRRPPGWPPPLAPVMAPRVGCPESVHRQSENESQRVVEAHRPPHQETPAKARQSRAQSHPVDQPLACFEPSTAHFSVVGSTTFCLLNATSGVPVAHRKPEQRLGLSHALHLPSCPPGRTCSLTVKRVYTRRPPGVHRLTSDARSSMTSGFGK